MDWNLVSVGFCGGRKSGEFEEKPAEQGRQPATNPTHLRSQIGDSNPGHTGEKRELSSLLHPSRPAPSYQLLITPASSLTNMKVIRMSR